MPVNECIKMRRVQCSEMGGLAPDPVDAKAREIAEPIVNAIKARGEEALLEYAVKLGDLKEGEKHIYSKADLEAAWKGISEEEQGVLQRTADRIRVFAQAQRDSIKEIESPIPGGMAGQSVAAVERAGCYAPGGRYPLPSSVLMTAITARVAGCKEVWVASPRPVPATLAAAFISEADGLLAVGGAQAIAALAYGSGVVPKCDAVCGPGNRFVTAAKSMVAGRVAIDMLAGPSECLVLADESADPEVIAGDLIAQAEHDVAAVPELVTTDEALIEKVEAALNRQLADLPTADVAKVALADNSWVVLAPNMETAIKICDAAAAEHLEVHTKDPQAVADQLNHYGGLFIGEGCAEVLGDYGAGPNHTLPTGGTARCTGGLSVFTFLRMRTWMRIDDPAASQDLVEDSIKLARMEGLEGHARSAERRLLSAKRQKTS